VESEGGGAGASLIQQTAPTAMIGNITMQSETINSSTVTGGLVAENHGDIFNAAPAGGTISVSAPADGCAIAGGLVGINYGIVRFSHTGGSVSAVDNNSTGCVQVGGLAAGDFSTKQDPNAYIGFSYSTAAVTGSGSRYSPRLPFFPVSIYEVSDLFLVERFEKLGGSFAGRRVHPHVERCVEPEAESTIRVIKLYRGNAQIGYDRVGRVDALAACYRSDLRKIRVNTVEAIAKSLKPFASLSQGCNILVDPDNLCGLKGFQNRFGMTA
jgi:hypothetical protein